MHHRHIEIILLAAATQQVAQKHHMTALQLHEALSTLMPHAVDTVLKQASTLAVMPLRSPGA